MKTNLLLFQITLRVINDENAAPLYDRRMLFTSAAQNISGFEPISAIMTVVIFLSLNIPESECACKTINGLTETCLDRSDAVCRPKGAGLTGLTGFRFLLL